MRPKIDRLNLNHGLWLSVLIITLIIQLAHWQEYVRYDRGLIEHGDYWLLITGHFSHFNWMHWLLNSVGLVIVALFFSAYGTLVHWICVFFVSSIFVSLGLYWLHPEISWYVGLSGVLHGLFIFGVIGEIRKYPVSGYVLMLLFIMKLVWEMYFGALPGSEGMTGGHVVTDAHLYGAIGGAVSATVIAAVIVLAEKLRRASINIVLL